MTGELLRGPEVEQLLRGCLEVERTADGWLPHRLPRRAREQNTDPQLAMAEAQPSGVRLAFRTAAATIEVDTVPTKRLYTGAPPRPDGTYDLVVDGRLTAQSAVPGGRTMTVDMATGRTTTEAGPAGTLRFDGLGEQIKDVEIWLPHDETTEIVELRSDAPLDPTPVGERPTWVHHGSSISHGSNAVSPTGTWPAVAARRAGVELVNLGIGGSALLDPFVARVLRDTPADLISIKVGINLVNTDLMRMRAFIPAVHGFLDTIREGHRDTPILLVSPILCPIHEDTPGPAAPDPTALAQGRLAFIATGDPGEVKAGRLTLRSIRSALAEIVLHRAKEDPNLSYLDGRRLYGEQDAERLPLPDRLHPDADTHRLIGRRFADVGLDWLSRATPSS